jgi:hypothetical protein
MPKRLLVSSRESGICFAYAAKKAIIIPLGARPFGPARFRIML